jgi:hypothetical protein
MYLGFWRDVSMTIRIISTHSIRAIRAYWFKCTCRCHIWTRPAMSRNFQAKHDGNRCSHISGLCMKAFTSLRALMKSALPLLIKSAASEALDTSRFWGSRSDLSCHQLDHTSHRAEGFFNCRWQVKQQLKYLTTINCRPSPFGANVSVRVDTPSVALHP